MDLPNTAGVSIKTEPGTLEGDGRDISDTNKDIDLLDVKQECLEENERFDRTTGEIFVCVPALLDHPYSKATDLPNTDSVAIKMELGTAESMPDTDIDIDLQDIKKECLDYAERIDSTTTEAFTAKENGNLCQTVSDLNNSCKFKLQGNTSSVPSPDSLAGHNYKYPRVSQLENSMLSNIDRISFTCPECNYSCSKYSLLKRHMFVHSRRNPFSCSECNFVCSQYSLLKRHMFIHTGKKPFSCSECTYSCFEIGNLRSHIRTHTGEKPFSCSDCSYSSSQKTNLINHMFTHSGDKPFSCSDCKYSGSRKSNLKNHMLIHTTEKIFSCIECNYVCERKSLIKNHILSHR